MDDKQLLALIGRVDVETPGVPLVGLLRDEVKVGDYQARLLAIARTVQAAERERYARLPALPKPRVLASGTIAGKAIELRGWHTEDIEIWERQHGLKFGA